MSAAITIASDHCTLWFEGWWSTCCQAHDVDYGGLVPRAVADETLMACVLALAPETGWFAIATSLVAAGMFMATRVWGGWFYKAPRKAG